MQIEKLTCRRQGQCGRDTAVALDEWHSWALIVVQARAGESRDGSERAGRLSRLSPNAHGRIQPGQASSAHPQPACAATLPSTDVSEGTRAQGVGTESDRSGEHWVRGSEGGREGGGGGEERWKEEHRFFCRKRPPTKGPGFISSHQRKEDALRASGMAGIEPMPVRTAVCRLDQWAREASHTKASQATSFNSIVNSTMLLAKFDGALSF